MTNADQATEEDASILADKQFCKFWMQTMEIFVRILLLTVNGLALLVKSFDLSQNVEKLP